MSRMDERVNSAKVNGRREAGKGCRVVRFMILVFRDQPPAKHRAERRRMP